MLIILIIFNQSNKYIHSIMQQQQQHAKLGKKRKRTSLELLMEDPLLNQETQLKLNKLLSSFKQKENFASHYRDYHSKCKHSESKASRKNNH